MLARLMQSKEAQTVTCGDICYLKTDGKKILMDYGDTYTDATDPYLLYICEVCNAIFETDRVRAHLTSD